MSQLLQTHTRPSRVLGILAALGGRWGWRWWFPIAVGLFRAVIGRITMQTSPDLLRMDQSPAGWFMLSSLAALLVLWGWGSRFALSLGYRRTEVFVTTAVASVLFLSGAQLLSSVANQVELAIVGPGGTRVFALETGGGKLGTDEGIFYASLIPTQIYLVPFTVGLVLALCWTMRWSVVGMVAGLVTSAALIIAMLGVWDVIGGWMGASQDVSGIAAMSLCVVVMFALAWIAFRRVPV
ncbi:MAG: hypothetical protein Q4P15_09920 [Propionibacteriaceae bacterium]|nr:hypothetical protein [Propionibacteriaceae bacterium]